MGIPNKILKRKELKIKLVKADAAKIKELELQSAFTWEGMTMNSGV